MSLLRHFDRLLRRMSLTAAAMLLTANAFAAYPERPITLIVIQCRTRPRG